MIRITTTIFCDACGNWLEIDISDKAHRRKARQVARADGWLCAVRVPDGTLEDYCPDCQNQEAVAA